VLRCLFKSLVLRSKRRLKKEKVEVEGWRLNTNVEFRTHNL